MEIGLRIAGVGEGDEVVTTPMTWVSTSNVIIETGATPVFADIDPVTRNIDLDLLEKAITPRTKPSCRYISLVCPWIWTASTASPATINCA